MTEGLLEGLLGSDAEADESGVEPGAEAATQAAMAVALQHPRSPGLENETAAFLRDQRKMLHLQMEHLHEQRELNLRHLRVRRWREGPRPVRT